jgi:ComF family protein
MSEDSIHGERCRNCPDGTLHYRAARAALAYGTPVRALIHAFKFRFHSGLGPHLASYLTAPYRRRFQGEIDAIVPVPLHWLRLRWREFNQSEELARHLGEKVQVPVMSDWLKRVRFTRTQSRLRTRSAKRRNVQNAFRVIDPESVMGQRILLVDDVFTTGHTVNECARVLMEAGACEVSVLTLAKVVHGARP